MTYLWCFGLLVLGTLYYVALVYYQAFTRETHRGVAVDDGSENPSRATDIFDYCPFEPPDPWDKSIVNYVDVKYGYLKDCTPNKHLSAVTYLAKGKVILKKGKQDFVCQGSCIDYVNDDVSKLRKWTSINNTVFDCDFVETVCNSSTASNRYIHVQIAEKKSTKKVHINAQRNPDVMLMVIDSAASTQVIRALPRTVNFLVNGMKAIEFRKFNRVGSNSRANGFPALIGERLTLQLLLF
ncbi:hypothetical protein GCK32_003375 [Trichostrongylus colubriformis]|uniref:Uncharacterized protein n=1 Tax=Trichostrongylus colubriformis TaxID=6319 RepID=A0AAN8EXK7_TRICO